MALQVINTDSVGAGTRINLGSDDDLYVASSVVVATTDSNSAIVSTGTGQDVHIEGQVLSVGICLDLGSANAAANAETYLGESSIVRSFGGRAIALYGGGQSIELHGKVFAQSTGINVIYGTGADSYIGNYGLISSRNMGIFCETLDNVTIENAGTIKGDDFGIRFESAGNNIRIVNSGTIMGGAGITNSSPGTMTIENSGLIRNGVVLGEQDDTYDGSLGRITGDIEAGSGNDDVIGGAGSERIIGQSGADTLTGGGGRDQFIYEAAGDSTTTSDGRDLISDFSQKERDFLDLSSLGVDELDFVGTKHFTEADQVRYQIKGNATTVFVNLDTDNAAEMAIRLTGKIHLEANDFAL